MFIVKVNSDNYVWYLRSTTWTSDIDRASTFDTAEAAHVALQKAKPYTKPKLFKAAVITNK